MLFPRLNLKKTVCFSPSCCCLLSVGKKASKSQSSNLSRSLESLGKESDDSNVSQSLFGSSSRNRESLRGDPSNVCAGDKERFSIDQFRFEFLAVSSAKWNIIIRKFLVYTVFFENLSPGISVPFDFPPRFSGIFDRMVLISEFNKFWIFWKPFKIISESFATVF